MNYAPRLSPEYSCGKRNPLYPIRSTSFVSIVLYPMHISSLFIHCLKLINDKNVDIKVKYRLQIRDNVNVLNGSLKFT